MSSDTSTFEFFSFLLASFYYCFLTIASFLLTLLQCNGFSSVFVLWWRAFYRNTVTYKNFLNYL